MASRWIIWVGSGASSAHAPKPKIWLHLRHFLRARLSCSPGWIIYTLAPTYIPVPDLYIYMHMYDRIKLVPGPPNQTGERTNAFREINVQRDCSHASFYKYFFVNYYLRIFPVREESNWSAHARGHTPFPTERIYGCCQSAERPSPPPFCPVIADRGSQLVGSKSSYRQT